MSGPLPMMRLLVVRFWLFPVSVSRCPQVSLCVGTPVKQPVVVWCSSEWVDKKQCEKVFRGSKLEKRFTDTEQFIWMKYKIKCKMFSSIWRLLRNLMQPPAGRVRHGRGITVTYTQQVSHVYQSADLFPSSLLETSSAAESSMKNGSS